ncbi:2-methylcitrate dehydratase PrpD [Pararhizobium capsulatum DSM 1112]|uniref:2-methylcitrate dehydratase PrpD n=1 Tax=Pararhizobium capsulatum DSM 1112 TaxID=1121113 RepID=A0ABU0BXQ8_9HYPH|nr:MmgE/PrpD family protein [Pararhizobium capsulatum]MDQ0323051.1 2-methylcitrate dehydratase PrpD [Pararhizobium capsulatum DSM 1112]
MLENDTGSIAPGAALAERIADVLAVLRLDNIPMEAREIAVNDLIDMAGLCVATRDADYIRVLIEASDDAGKCTAIGHARGFDAATAALINGTATHGEDFDDTLEGAPIRVGAMVLPAVLAAAQRFERSGADTLKGIVAGLEMVCRFNTIVPGAIHKAGFHPVGIIGALGATAGVGVTLGLDRKQLTDAFGIAGSFASGIGEFLTEGAWTKRLHPGWAAQSGYRAALLGRAGFFGPRTVFDGPRNVFKVFSQSAPADRHAVIAGLGEKWLMQAIAFKPYACGTMIHPFIDCMLRLRETGIDADSIVSIESETSEGLVDRLWEPLAAKYRPPSGYAAKFSMPFCMAVAFLEGDAGLEQFSDAKAADSRVLELAGKIRYVIDSANEYPKNYTGHIRASLRDGTEIEFRQPHFRGGVREPLTRDQLIGKFRGNIAHGRGSIEYGQALLDFCLNIAKHKDLSVGLAGIGLCGESA